MTKQQLILYRMSHKLKDAVHLPTNALTLITDEDIDSYEVEYDSRFLKNKGQDSVAIREAKSVILDGITTVYGRDSKQYKYMERNLRLEPSLVGNHYESVPSPNQIRRLKEGAIEDMKKTGGFTVATGGVDSSSMSEIDDAIQFLIANGFDYGKDFSSHNAVSIATALIPEKIEAKLESLSPCPEGHPWSFDSDIYECDNGVKESYKLSCDDDCHSRILDYTFESGNLNVDAGTCEESN